MTILNVKVYSLALDGLDLLRVLVRVDDDHPVALHRLAPARFHHLLNSLATPGSPGREEGSKGGVSFYLEGELWQLWGEKADTGEEYQSNKLLKYGSAVNLIKDLMLHASSCSPSPPRRGPGSP